MERLECLGCCIEPPCDQGRLAGASELEKSGRVHREPGCTLNPIGLMPASRFFLLQSTKSEAAVPGLVADCPNATLAKIVTTIRHDGALEGGCDVT